MGSFESAGVTQLVECDLAKVDVAGSNPVSRSNLHCGPNRYCASNDRGACDFASRQISWRNQKLMNRAFLVSFCLPLFSLSLYAQQYKSAAAGAPPSDLAPAVASALDSTGTKITKADGSA